MAKRDPRLYADDGGVWRQCGPDQRFGLAWHEIEWVLCCSWEGAHGATGLGVELHAKDGGIGLELGGPGREADEPVLADVVAALAARLGLPERWYSEILERPPKQRVVTVWTRSAPPRVHADDRGLWCNDLDQLTECGRVEAVAARSGPDGGVTIELEVADPQYGDLRELHDASPGFTECSRAMTARLPFLPAEWLTEIRNIPAGSAAMWRRSFPEGYRQLYADDLGVSREDAPGEPVSIAG